MSLTIQTLFKDLYKTCGCGRKNCLIPIFDNRGIIGKFNAGHNNYKGKRFKVRDYWYLYMPKYFSSNFNGTVREHIYFYQEKHKLCMLPWGVVHHKDENKENNMPWNLHGMIRSQHQSLHSKGKHKDTSDRKCNICNSFKTYFRKDIKAFTWFKHKEKWVCDKCLRKIKNS